MLVPVRRAGAGGGAGGRLMSDAESSDASRSGSTPVTDGHRAKEVAIFDPAVCVADAWAERAMMQLFGGIPSAAFVAWDQVLGRPDDAGIRLAAGQLVHALNHLAIFGPSYLDLVDRTLAAQP